MLTNHQNIALSEIKKFILDDSSQVFILKGYAGTGKTFLIKEITNFLDGIFLNYHLAAPTGRASRMLTERTGLEASTIHKLLYAHSNVEMGDEEETDDLVFNFSVKNNNQESINDVYIFDESSMISDNKNNEAERLRFGSGRLLLDLMEFVGFNTTVNIPNLKRKIIFIGDPAQLPPIGNNFSFALSKQYLIDEYNVSVQEYTLKDVVRQSSTSSLLSAASKIRDSIEKKEYNKFDINSDVNVIKENSRFKEKWKENINDTILITYSNEEALRANLNIRNSFLSPNEKEILPNEKLIVVANNYNFGLMNGDFINTVEIWPAVEHTIRLKGREKPITLVFREATIKYFGENNREIEKEVFLLDSLLWSEQRNLGRDELVALRILAAQKLDVKFPLKSLKKTNPIQYKKEKDIYIEELQNSKYYNALQVKFGYAVTCHKAQGGEWDNVFVKFDGYKSTQNEYFFRWAYTAITRAKEVVFAINPPKFSPWSNMISPILVKSKVVEREAISNQTEVEIPNSITNIIPKNIYLKVLAIIENEQIEIVETKELDWKLRFILRADNQLIHLDFNYTKKGKIKLNIFQFPNDIARELLTELFGNISQVSVYEKRNIDEIFPEHFLEEFYFLIKEIFSKTDIEIYSLEHLEYTEKYSFKNSLEFCVVLLSYDSNNRFSKSGPRLELSSNAEFGSECLRIIVEGISNEY